MGGEFQLKAMEFGLKVTRARTLKEQKLKHME